jgi:hypothetical protein
MIYYSNIYFKKILHFCIKIYVLIIIIVLKVLESEKVFNV